MSEANRSPLGRSRKHARVTLLNGAYIPIAHNADYVCHEDAAETIGNALIETEMRRFSLPLEIGYLRFKSQALRILKTVVMRNPRAIFGKRQGWKETL